VVVKNIVGQAVRNNDFWQRADEVEDIWDAINSGSHLLLCAPRRVGKTSMMYKILDNPQPNYIPIYIDTESADSQYEFWLKIFNALMEDEFINGLQTRAKHFWSKIKRINITKISADGVEFGEGDVVDHKLAFKRLIKDLDDDKKLIIMIDEFAQAIENIIKYEDTKNAVSLLKAHRELRQDVKFSQKVTFIYAGSIGLESVVSKIGASKHINDLNNIKVSPLSFSAAICLQRCLSQA
jgi:AAA+ ATPase superfamily predicted ATPase